MQTQLTVGPNVGPSEHLIPESGFSFVAQRRMLIGCGVRGRARRGAGHRAFAFEAVVESGVVRGGCCALRVCIQSSAQPNCTEELCVFDENRVAARDKHLERLRGQLRQPQRLEHALEVPFGIGCASQMWRFVFGNTLASGRHQITLGARARQRALRRRRRPRLEAANVARLFDPNVQIASDVRHALAARRHTRHVLVFGHKLERHKQLAGDERVIGLRRCMLLVGRQHGVHVLRLVRRGVGRLLLVLLQQRGFCWRRHVVGQEAAGRRKRHDAVESGRATVQLYEPLGAQSVRARARRLLPGRRRLRALSDDGRLRCGWLCGS